MFKFGWQGFWRNIWLSLITVLIVFLNLFLMTSVMGLNVVSRQTLTAVKAKINLSVFFTAATSEQRAEEIRQLILKKTEVATVRLISRSERLTTLENSQSDKKLVAEVVEQLGNNPLGPGLVITAKTLDGYGAIANEFKAEKYKNIVEDTGREYETNQSVISKLSLIVKRVEMISWWLTALFALIAFLMVFNTIRVAIYSQREEIGMMKLVGASDAFVRGPFFITSLIYGIIASLLATGIMIPLLGLANPYFSTFFAGYDINVLGYVQSHLWVILGLEIASGCVISAISSVMAIGRYLRV